MPKIVHVVLLILGTAGAMYAQIADPLPAHIEKRGLAVQIRDVVRLPDTRGLRPADQDVVPAGWARPSYLRDLPDGRRFVNDSRGLLYLLDKNNQPSVYANVGAAFPLSVYNRLASGFIGFDFHPDFARNGLFYTTHTERVMGNPATPDFIPPGFTRADVTFHNVITEWHATNPGANTFEGTRREIFRVGHVVANLFHPIGHVEFNPTSKPGAPDYGLLYVSVSDLAFSNGGGPNANNPGQTQRLDSIATAILRIDPRSPSVSGGIKGLGDYTIPAINKFAADGDPKTLGEIYAYGFRNSAPALLGSHRRNDVRVGHRDEQHRGDQHRPRRRELRLDAARGVLRERRSTRPGGTLDQLYPLPAEILDGTEKDGFTYPVAIYDHNDGQSVSGGFAVPRPHRRASRQVRVRRHPARPSVRRRSCGDEEGG